MNIAIIPARYASTRFPRKMLATLGGKPLLQWVWEGVQQSEKIQRVYIATDHQEIVQLAENFNAEVLMTDPDLPSGTDRIAAALEQLEQQNIRPEIIVNVQGDEPQIKGTVLDALLQTMLESNASMATLARRMDENEEASNPHIVKVVTDHQGKALYFSRAPIPFHRDKNEAAAESYYHHIGIYGYRTEILRRIVQWPQTTLERMEKLEQLRALQNGIAIQVVPTSLKTIGVDTPEDLELLESMITK